MNNNNKKRIFIANDASVLNTGYGVYGKEILTRLHNSGKYEIAELGCYVGHDDPRIKSIPWKFYPNAVSTNDERIKQYQAATLNQFGMWRFNRALVDFKPHIVFDVRDYWMYSYQELSPYKKYFNWVLMPTTDSAPPRTEWLYTFANADLIVPYTKWAKDVLTQFCGNQINLFPKIANAGFNSSEFYPIENKEGHKKKYFDANYDVVGLVMRNQKRKLIPDILLVYRSYLELLKAAGRQDLHDNSILYLHTSYPEDNGWDLPGLLLEFNLLDKTYLSYICKKCNQFFPGKFQSSITNCKYCGEKSAVIASPSNSVSTSQLNEVYNLFDIFIQYAICEGFGMPQVEAAACGLQIASVDYSAMTEIAENLYGYKIPVDRVFRELEINADRVYPNNEATVKILYDFFVNKTQEEKIENSKKIRDKCIELYSWDNVYKVWEECFDSIDIKSKADWSSSNVSEVNTSIKVPNNLDAQTFIEFICNNIINEPDLLKTAFIQNLIKDANGGLVARNQAISVMNQKQIVETLESIMNNKVSCERMRTDPASLKKEDFIP